MPPREITKSDYYLLSCMSVCPSMWNISSPTGQNTTGKNSFFNSCVLTYKVNFLMMVMATTETCRNVEWLCEKEKK